MRKNILASAHRGPGPDDPASSHAVCGTPDDTGFHAHEDADHCAVMPRLDAFEIKQYRLQKGMTQVQFARSYGLSLRTLKRWEGDSPLPSSVEALVRIASDWATSLASQKSAKPEQTLNVGRPVNSQAATEMA